METQPASIALRIGVTGHRPDPSKSRPIPDVTRLRGTVRAIFQHIRDAVHGVANSRRGSLQIVSALAEGADQWMAEEALSLGYELHCALPFRRARYLEDFSDPAARAEFTRLLGRATAVLELDGGAGETTGALNGSSAAYEAAGRAVLDGSDLLVAAWDGRPPQGPGGTGAVVADALRRRMGVVWVPWASPETWTLRLPTPTADALGDAARLRAHVQGLLFRDHP